MLQGAKRGTSSPNLYHKGFPEKSTPELSLKMNPSWLAWRWWRQPLQAEQAAEEAGSARARAEKRPARRCAGTSGGREPGRKQCPRSSLPLALPPGPRHVTEARTTGFGLEGQLASEWRHRLEDGVTGKGPRGEQKYKPSDSEIFGESPSSSPERRYKWVPQILRKQKPMGLHT